MRAAGTTQGNQNGGSQPTLAGAANARLPVQGEQPLTLSSGPEAGSGMIDDGNSYQTQFPDPDWHQIAERAANEKDPKKLAFLIKALCDRLEELRQSKFSDRK